MGFLNSDSLPYLVEKLTDGANIKIAGNNKGDRVSTVVSKISEKAKDVTKATFQKVTNTSTTFRTGTGNVDVSATMEEGFSNIGIKGNTLVNIIDSWSNKNKSWLINDVENKTLTITATPEKDTNHQNLVLGSALFKPSTVYTVFFIVLENTLDNVFCYLDHYKDYASANYVTLSSKEVGLIKRKFTTKSDLSAINSKYNFYVSGACTKGYIKLTYPAILEGDWSNKEIPEYFTGLKSVGEENTSIDTNKKNGSKIEIISTGNIGNMQDTVSNTPHNSNKAKILLDEPLRKINDTVFDEFLEDGTLIRRCGEVVLDGSENWKAYSGTDSDEKTWKRFGILLPDVVNTYHLDSSKSICDSLLYDYNDDKQDCEYTLSYKNLYIYKHSFDGNVTKFKQWLNANPITLVYKLDTPIITKLTPLQVRLYKQGHLSLNTIPTESTHTVLLNKSAQIENSVEEVKSLDKRVENLEGIYDDVILDTSRKFSLLEFDYNFTKTMMEDE